MGNCCLAHSQFLENPEYNEHIQLQIIERDRLGNFISRCPVSFSLLPPQEQVFCLINLPKTSVIACGCIIPGLDPRDECDKECQDSFALFFCDTQILAVLFDGHGKDGKRVSLFCRDFMKKYFEKNNENFENDPKGSIELMVDECEYELSLSGIEASLSGTTAVVVVINSLGIHAGSVGDSRAILAVLPKDFIESKVGHSTIPFRRTVKPSRLLDLVALTIDQKPNHEGELERIVAAGGVVEKLADEMGHPIGPYRVWKKNGNLPGLAMSRSIGDKFAHDIGVSSIPIIHSFTHYPTADQFIVIASDGIWDVMDNLEVVNFVEKFRKSCQNNGANYPAKTSNSTIARLLCEEARYRWFGVIEEEDVMIDDISCVILEFSNCLNQKLDEKLEVEERKVKNFKSFAIQHALQMGKTEKAVRKDPTRGSMANDDSTLTEALSEL